MEAARNESAEKQAEIDARSAELKAKQPEILQAIVSDKAISAATEEKLKAFLDAFSKTFA